MGLQQNEVQPSNETGRKSNHIRFFDDSSRIDIEKLGGKGAMLAKMTQESLPVPPGFTITTDAWKEVIANNGELPEQIWEQTLNALKSIEQKTGKRLGDPDNPLTYSLRSGAKFSMPGMMDTILNLGINDKTLPGLAEQVGWECALTSYLRLIEMYSIEVYEIPHRQFRDARHQFLERFKVERENRLTVEQLREMVEGLKKIVVVETNGTEFEQDLMVQLREGIKAIFDSFMNPAAIDYRNRFGIPHDVGTAVNLQIMVYGNAGEDSGSAVIFTRDQETGEKGRLGGHFLTNAQGEQVVAGVDDTLPVSQLPSNISTQVGNHVTAIERILKGLGDIEATWEYGKLWLLQIRRAKLPPQATIRSTADMIEEGLITEEEALRRISPDHISAIREPRFDQAALEKAREKNLITKGMPVHSGIGTGCIYLDDEEAKRAVKRGESVVLICDHFDPNDVELIVGIPTERGRRLRLQAIITTTGSPSSHMGLVMSATNTTGVMGCNDLEINLDTHTVTVKGEIYKQGTAVSVDSHTGEILLGEIPKTGTPTLPPIISTFIKSWEQAWGKDNPWAAFLFPVSEESAHHSRKRELRSIRKDAEKVWQSAKARQIHLLNTAFPRDIIIPTTIVRGNDKQAIRSAMLGVIETGYSNYPRSTFDPDLLTAPYAKDLDTAAKIDAWLANPDSEHSKWGGLDQWQTIEGTDGQQHKLEAILIAKDPKDKLAPELKAEHFVCTMRCVTSSPPQVIIDVVDHTQHLRSFSIAQESQTMQIVGVANPETPNNLGQINLRFGRDHFDSDKLQTLTRQLAGSPSDSHVQALRRKIADTSPEQDLTQINEEKPIDSLRLLMDKNLLTAQDYQLFIKDRSLDVITFVANNVIHNWWQHHALPHLMWALKEVTGATVLEIQGRFNDKDKELSWIRVYGTKGEEEQRITTFTS